MNEKPSPNILLRIRLTIKKMTKNNEKIRKKEKITVTLKNRIGCTKKIKIKNLPSLPPIIFKINNMRDKEKTNNSIKIFKKTIIVIFSKKIMNSKKFKIAPIIKLNIKHHCGIFLNLISK